MASYATTHRKGVKWYQKLAIELLLGMSVVNALVVFKEVTKTKIKFSKFKELLVEQLLSDAGVVTPSISGSSVPHHHLVERTGALGKKLDEHVPPVTQKRSKKVAVVGHERTLQNHTHIVVYALDSH